MKTVMRQRLLSQRLQKTVRGDMSKDPAAKPSKATTSTYSLTLAIVVDVYIFVVVPLFAALIYYMCCCVAGSGFQERKIR